MILKTILTAVLFIQIFPSFVFAKDSKIRIELEA